jgi:hypothetical protein
LRCRPSLQEIIGRAVTEPEYRELLLSEADRALEGYELSKEEAASLKRLRPDTFDAVAGELGERISRADGLRPFLDGKSTP